MEQADLWMANSNEAMEISIVKPSPSGLKTTTSFNPKFTYPIFGDEEQIFGYQALKINLRFHASDMRPNLHISYSKKFKTIGSTEPSDIDGTLKRLLPEVAFARSSDFEAALNQIPADWSPLGERIREFATKDGTYEVWKGSLAELAIKQMINRIQILVPLFIEGGTYIGTDDSEHLDRWTVFFLYRRREVAGSPGQHVYEFAGYSTVYRFLLYKNLTLAASSQGVEHVKKDDFELPTGDFSLTELPCRSRISQFIILPPFQGKGNAGRLYGTIFDHYQHNPQTIEITVEDPNEAFDDLRDLEDLGFLLKMPEFRDLHINTEISIPKEGPAPKDIVAPAGLEELRLKAKIAPRQFHRVVEMHLMSKLPAAVRPGIEQQAARHFASKEQAAEYKLWKLLVKQRLYRHNKELLGQLERTERIDKLEETLSAVEFEYARLLAKFERQSKPAGASANGKRKLEEENGEPASKKARVEDA